MFDAGGVMICLDLQHKVWIECCYCCCCCSCSCVCSCFCCSFCWFFCCFPCRWGAGIMPAETPHSYSRACWHMMQVAVNICTHVQSYSIHISITTLHVCICMVPYPCLPCMYCVHRLQTMR